MANLLIAWEQTLTVPAASGSGVSPAFQVPCAEAEAIHCCCHERLTPATKLYHSDGLNPPKV